MKDIIVQVGASDEGDFQVLYYDPEVSTWMYFGHLASHDYVYGTLTTSRSQIGDLDRVVVKIYQPGVSDALDQIVHKEDLVSNDFYRIIVASGAAMLALEPGCVFVVDHDKGG